MARRPGRPARREDLNVVKRRAWAALARGLVVPVVVAEGLDRYLRVVVAAAAPGEEAAPVTELARRRALRRPDVVGAARGPSRGVVAGPGEVKGSDETEVVRRPRRRGQLLLAVDDS